MWECMGFAYSDPENLVSGEGVANLAHFWIVVGLLHGTEIVFVSLVGGCQNWNCWCHIPLVRQGPLDL